MLEKDDYQEPVCPLSPPPKRVWHDPPERIPLDRVIAECDRLFGEEQPFLLGEHLRHWRRKAAELGDKRSELSLLNELMGHYRMTGDRERGLEAVRDGFRLIGEVGIEGSVSAGTILLNGATALKSFGKVKEALQHYAEAFRCYGTHLAPEDPRYAGLFNNMAAAYADNGEFRHAEAYYRKALVLLKEKSQLMDRAVTEINLAQLYHRQDPSDPRIAECLDRAYGCFESPEAEYGSYYAHTCRKCAGAFGDLGEKDRERELNKRADAFYDAAAQKSAAEARKDPEKDDARKVESAVRSGSDRKIPEDTGRPVPSSGRGFMRGIDLAKEWFESAGLPAIREKCPDALPFLAAGLAGSGSECFGFDDEISRDHDFEVRFSIWISEEQEARFGFRLERLYAELRKQASASEKSGKSAWGQPGGGVETIESFFQRHLGIPGAPRHWEQWLRIPEYAFAEAVNGAVFLDNPGAFTAVRQTILTGMPRDVLLKKLAARAALMAQSGQYNFARCLKHGERGAAHLALAEFVRTTGSMIHLLNGAFAPYYKWLLKSLRTLPVLGDMADPLEFLLADDAPDDLRLSVVEDICRRTASVLRDRGFSDSQETFLEAHAMELMRRIENREIRSLHIMEG